MRLLLTAFGVDYAQWRALTRTALKLDFRVSSSGARGGSGGPRAATVIIARLAMYTLFGAGTAFSVGVIADPFMAGTIVTTVVIMMVGTAMLVEHNATVLSPADHAMLGVLPVSSRTYFAARLTNVLMYTLGATTALGWLPVGAFLVRHGVVVGAAAAIAIFASSIGVTLAVIVGYLSLVRRLGAGRLQHAVSYLQLVTGVLVYGGFFIVPELVPTAALESLRLADVPWLLLYPGAWFASYLSLATGHAGTGEVLAAIGSVALLALLVAKLRGRISLEYAEQLAAIMTAAAPASRRPRTSAIASGRWFGRGEARAVALLVRSHFRNDLKFRMGVLGILPMTLLYLLMGLRNGDGLRADADPGRISMVTIAVILFPIMLKMSVAQSDAFRASWIFFAMPADRTRLVRASTQVLVAFFVLPYLVFVGLTLVWFTESVPYLVVYLAFAGAWSYLALLVVTFFDPELPFAKPPAKGFDARLFGALLGVGVFGAFLPWLANLLYRSLTASAITFAIIAAVSLLLGRATRARVERRAALMEFLG